MGRYLSNVKTKKAFYAKRKVKTILHTTHFFEYLQTKSKAPYYGFWTCRYLVESNILKFWQKNTYSGLIISNIHYIWRFGVNWFIQEIHLAHFLQSYGHGFLIIQFPGFDYPVYRYIVIIPEVLPSTGWTGWPPATGLP